MHYIYKNEKYVQTIGNGKFFLESVNKKMSVRSLGTIFIKLSFLINDIYIIQNLEMNFQTRRICDKASNR